MSGCCDLCLQTQTMSRKMKPTAIPIMTPTATANSRPSHNIRVTIGNADIKQKIILIRHSVCSSSVPSYFSVHPLLAAACAAALNDRRPAAGNTSDHPLCDRRGDVGCRDLIIPDLATPMQFRREPCAVDLWACRRTASNGHERVEKISQYTFLNCDHECVAII